jgi:acetylglutamate kinase
VNLFGDDMIPVIAPLGAGRNGETYNINGDTAAGAIAAALKADRLLLLTDVAGVKNAEGEVVTALTAAEVEDMTASRRDRGRHDPQDRNRASRGRNGVRACTIVDGRVPNAVLLELFTDHGAGSMIRA